MQPMSKLPAVGIIGAGVWGLTACKALADFGVPHTCFEASDEVGGNWYFQNPNGVSSAYRSLHIDISKPSISFRDFPMPERYPDYPHHSHIFEWLRDYADAFGVRERIRFNTRVRRAERGARGGWSITLDDGSQRDLRRAARLQRPPLGPAPTGLPGQLRRAADPLARLRRPEHAARSPRQARARRRHRQQRRRHRLRARAQDGLRHRLPLDALGRVRDPQVHLRQTCRPGRQDQPAHPDRPAAPARAACCRGSSPGAWRTSGCRRPTTSSSTRTRPSPASCSGASARATRSPRATWPSCSAIACASPTAASSAVDAIIYATGYNVSFPFFDPRLPHRAGKRAAALQAHAQARHRRPRLHRARPADPDDLPLLRAAVEARGALAERRLGAAAGGRRWKRRSSATRRSTPAHFTNKPRHTMQLEWYGFQHELLTRSIPRGQARAREGAPTGLRQRRPRAALAGAGVAA